MVRRKWLSFCWIMGLTHMQNKVSVTDMIYMRDVYVMYVYVCVYDCMINFMFVCLFVQMIVCISSSLIS